MKNKINIIILFFISFCLNLFALKINNEIKFDNIVEYNISGLQNAYMGNNSNQIFLTIHLKNVISNANIKINRKSFTGIFAFSKHGEYIGKIGNFNSYNEDGIVSVGPLTVLNDKIYISDFAKNELIVFSEKSLKYLFNIKYISKPIFSFPSFIYKNKVFFLQIGPYTRTKKGKLIMNNFKKVAIGDLFNDRNSQQYKIKNFKFIYSTKKEFKNFWYDDRIIKNKVIKYYLKKWKKQQDKNVSFNFIFSKSNIGPLFYLSSICFDRDDNFYLANSFGTKIKKYNLKGDSLNTFIITKYFTIRKKELDKYKNILSNKLKNKNKIKDFGFKYKLSFLKKIFYDREHNNIILNYVLEDIFLQYAHLPPAKSYLLVYSLDKRKAISDFIPINFIPLNIDTEKRELIGVQQRKGDIFLQFYKWEY